MMEKKSLPQQKDPPFTPVQFRKACPVRLRDLSLGEKWLQDRIDEDPSILGLGDLDVLRREKPQSSGGRLDFYMSDTDNNLRYTVEIMLGTLDESHIIRAIEYWDIEKQRYPSYDHRAVIVAEEITSRFFNVIRLLNRSIPLIALQLNAFTIDESVILHITKVLDVYSEVDDIEESGGERVDRHTWEQRANVDSLAAGDGIVGIIKNEIGAARVTYNKHHIAVGTSSHNFCWIHPKKSKQYCPVEVKTGEKNRDNFVNLLEKEGLLATPRGSENIMIRVTEKNLKESHDLLLKILQYCDHRSRTSDDQDI